MSGKSLLFRKKPLPCSFFVRPTLTVAEELLGCLLVRTINDQLLAGIIVETEAYLSRDDPACHAARGKTKRNAVMFEQGGVAYVYRIHQVHCLNTVTEDKGMGAAVLIRSLEPVAGLDLMAQRRGKEDLRQLCNGPGRLCQALDIHLDLNGTSLQKPPLYILPRYKNVEVIRTTRVGISSGKELPYRFCVANNPFVSQKPKL